MYVYFNSNRIAHPLPLRFEVVQGYVIIVNIYDEDGFILSLIENKSMVGKLYQIYNLFHLIVGSHIPDFACM